MSCIGDLEKPTIVYSPASQPDKGESLIIETCFAAELNHGKTRVCKLDLVAALFVATQKNVAGLNVSMPSIIVSTAAPPGE
jgi:hypothetical protein